MAWYSPDWPYRKRITIEGSNISGTHTDFPILVSVNDTNLSDHARSDGKDIVFTSGTARVHHEIENYSDGVGNIWVRVPKVHDVTDATLYMYYGNVASKDCTQDAGYKPSGVWDTNFKAVYHMNDSGSATTHINDSTTNNNLGTKKGANEPIETISGKIGNAQIFEPTDDYIRMAADFVPGATMCLEFWIKTSGDYENHGLFSTDADGGYGPFGSFYASRFYYEGDGGDFKRWEPLPASNVWQYLVLIADGAVAHFYVNLIEPGTTAQTDYPGVATFDYIGPGYQTDDNWDGYMDEIRFSNIERSIGWITTTFSSQNSPSTFLTFGAEDPLTDWYDSKWPYRKYIKISGSKISGTHTDFPILVHFDGDADLSKNARADGKDIIFTSGTTRTHSEIENFSSGSGNIWVRVPKLVDETDGYLWMYYGRDGDHSLDTGYLASGVWDTNYMMVQHMNDTTTSTITDSTTFSNDGTKTGANEPKETTHSGQIGKAQYFDGDDDKINCGRRSELDDMAQMTLEVWSYKNDVSGDEVWISKYKNPGYWNFYARSNDIGFYMDWDSLDGIWYSVNDVASDTWQNIALTYDAGGTANDPIMYINGSSVTVSELVNPDGSRVSDAAADVIIGDRPAGDQSFYGLIDEARISNTIRSAGWLLTGYNAMGSNSTFLTLGNQVSKSNIALDMLNTGTLRFYAIGAGEMSFTYS